MSTPHRYVGTLVPTVALGTIQAYAPDLNRYLNGLQAILTVSNMWLHRLNSGNIMIKWHIVLPLEQG